MRWYGMYHYNPHGYHGYPHPEGSSAESGREGNQLTPETEAETSSPWHFPYPFPPFMDPRGTYPPRSAGAHTGAFRTDRHGTMGPEASRQMSRLYDYAKQVSTASSASDSPPFGTQYSRESSTEATAKESSSHGSENQPTQSRTSSAGTFNEAVGNDRPSPLARYVSQMSNTSTVSSSSLHYSDEQEAGEPSSSVAAVAAAAAVNQQSKLEPRKLLLKGPSSDEKPSPSSASKSGGDSSPGSKIGRAEPDGSTDTLITPIESSFDHDHTLEPVSIPSSSSTATDSTLTNFTDLPPNVDDGGEVVGQNIDSRVRYSDSTSSELRLKQLESVNVIPKEENRMLSLIHI